MLVKIIGKLWHEVESVVFETQESAETDAIRFVDRKNHDTNTKVFLDIFKQLPEKTSEFQIEAWLDPTADEQDLIDTEIVVAVNERDVYTDDW